jgi:N-acetylated-alpha-linked acidic dipeptidase
MNKNFFPQSLAAAGTIVIVASLGLSQETGLRGFTRQEASAEQQLEQRYRSIPRAENLREYMRTITEDPHTAGTPASRKVAEFILSKFQSWGLNARIEEYEAFMPMPVERTLELVAPESYTALLREPAIPQDKDSSDQSQLSTFNAYSADGEATADVVYVNYGTPEDYAELEKLRVSVKDKIVIARYGRSWRGIKPKVAWEHGALGCIIYSDPKDDGFYQGDVYPDGSWRPWDGAQRGSVMDMPLYPGDPLSPGWGSEKGARKLDRADAKTILKIPVLPISYRDALPILRAIRGPVAPESWRGSLPITYHVGPGPARVRLKLAFDWQTRPLYNVVARIDGATFPDEWILYGNHHDAWVNGASDPTSGNVVLMETARALGELVKQGWKPKRTIILTSWDGEEWGLLGSTEWAEKHASELRDRAVIYINTDSTGKGWLTAGGSHSLQAFINEVARDIKGPRTGSSSVFDEARAHRLEQAKTDDAKKKIAGRRDLAIEALGSGSDYTAFLDHLAVASLNLGFGGDDAGGVYHSIYDSFAWYTQFSDGSFSHGVALSQLIGTAILRLSEAPVLPFQFADYATTISDYVEEIEQEHKKISGAPSLDLSPVRTSLGRLKRAGGAYEKAAARLTDTTPQTLASRSSDLKALNSLLFTSERLWRHEDGLPHRDWFKHLVYAPGLYTGYGVKTLPGIRESIEQKAWDDARRYVPLVAAAIGKVAGQVEKAAGLLTRITQR